MERELIPVNEAIDSGAWLRGEFPLPERNSPWERGESVEFQIKITGLSKLNLNEIDLVEELPTDLIKSDSLWFFSFEIVNLSKKEIDLFLSLIHI